MEAARKDALDWLQELSDKTRRLEPSFVEQAHLPLLLAMYCLPLTSCQCLLTVSVHNLRILYQGADCR